MPANDYPRVNLNKARARNIDCNKVRVPESRVYVYSLMKSFQKFSHRVNGGVAVSERREWLYSTLRAPS